MSSRKLQSEKRFYVLVGDIKLTDQILHIIGSYTIMGAFIEYNISGTIPDLDINVFGTFIHIDTEPNIQNKKVQSPQFLNLCQASINLYKQINVK